MRMPKTRSHSHSQRIGIEQFLPFTCAKRIRRSPHIATSIGYDNASRITSLLDTANAANSNSYGYDNLDRLIQTILPGTTYNYQYDLTGNRTAKGAGASNDAYSIQGGSNRIAQIVGADIIFGSGRQHQRHRLPAQQPLVLQAGRDGGCARMQHRVGDRRFARFRQKNNLGAIRMRAQVPSRLA